MPAPRILVNPFLNDFLYHILFHATTDEKRSLPKRYAKRVRNNIAARKFIDQSYLEEKIEILQALGFNWFLTIYEDTRVKIKFAKDIFDSYRPEGDKTQAKSIIEKKLYVTSDRKFAHEHGLIADVANSPQYSKNLLLSKAGYHIQKWKRQMSGPNTDTTLQHMEVAKYLVEMSLNMCLQFDYIEGYLGITRNDYKVLSYLYTKQHSFVDYGQVAQRFSNNLSITKVTGCIRRLTIKGMVSKTPVANEKRYQITALGISAIATFYKNILKANEF